MFFKFVISTFALVAVAFAVPTENKLRETDVTPIVSICTGTVSPSVGCVGIPVVSDTCVDFTGGKTIFNKAVSGVQTPNGFICTFFQNFGCESLTQTDSVVIAGTFNLATQLVPDGQGLVNFDDQASSFSCSPAD